MKKHRSPAGEACLAPAIPVFRRGRACPARLLGLICLLALAACGRKDENAAATAAPAAETRRPDGTLVIPASSPKLAQLRVAPVTRAEVPTDEVVSPGKIEVNPNRVSRVIMPVAGRIAGVLVKLGDAVRQGEPVVSIESPDADAAQSGYLQSEAAVNQAKSNLIKAEADSDRTSDLFQHNAIAKKEVLNAENALAQAKAAMAQAEAAREQAIRRVQLLGLKAGQFGERVTVRAPISGKVMDIAVAPGEYRNDTNAPLMTIADLSTVWVAADVPEGYIRFIQVGEPVEVRLTAYPGEVFRASVRRIADTVDPQTRTIKVRAEMENPRGRLRPEMFGTIRHIESTHVVPVVPPGAVVQDNGRTFVWREDSPGKFTPVDVKTAQRSGDVLPILTGLKTGDRIVVDGAMLLKAQ